MEMTKEERQALLDEAIDKTYTKLAAEAKPDIEKIQKLVADERKAFEEKIDADFKAYQEKSHAAEKESKNRIDALETKLNRPQVGNLDPNVVPGAKEYKASFFNCLRTGQLVLDEASQKYLDRQLEEKALVSDTAGTILIPEELEAEIYTSLPKINIIRKYATIRTITSNRIRRRSLTEVTMGWGVLELGGEPDETDVTPSEDYQYVEDLEGLARIGKNELADSDVSIESALAESFGRARAETEETGFVVGTGHLYRQPDGILNGTTVTRVETTAADAIAFNDVLDLIYAVPAQYRRNGVFVFASTTILALRKLKDTYDQYIWQSSQALGQPATLAGYPVEAQDDIPAIDSSSQCDIGFFGDIRAGYRIVDRQGMTIQTMRERWATAGLVGLLASARVTGGVIRADALRVLQEAA